MTAVNRTALLQTLALVRPALASKPHIPALTHVAFDSVYAYAYNDITGISVRCGVDLELCLPGELLIKALSNLPADEVLIQLPEAGGVSLSAGRSKLKLPSMPLDSFPFTLPDTEAAGTFELTKDLLRGLELCLVAVSTDPTHPAQMGVTIEADATLYSTDSVTMSRYKSDGKVDLPGNVPVILPTYFCNQLVLIGKAFPQELITIEVRDNSLIARFGEEATLFTKVVLDLEPMDFNRVIKKYCGGVDIAKEVESIPDVFEAAFERSLLVLSATHSGVTKVTPIDDKLKLHSTSSLGDADDTIPVRGVNFNGLQPFYVNPIHVLRASKSCTKMALLEKVLILTNDDCSFLHLIAHCHA